MDDGGPTRVKRTTASAIWKLLGLHKPHKPHKPNRQDKDIEALLSFLLKFSFLPYASIWQSLFQIGFGALNTVVGNSNPPHAITNPFTISHGSTGSRPIYSSYPTYDYPYPYVGALSYGL
jgi:hypothetical protein